ncbi:MAG: MarP family serine protease [Candidatus Dormibacteria bacterium]
MSYLDPIIVIVGIIAAVAGYRRGVLWVAASLVSLLLGILLASLVAPPLTKLITSGGRSVLAPAVSVFIFLFVTFLIQGLGTSLGERLRAHTIRSKLVWIDSASGALLGLATALFMAWLFGLMFAQSQWTLLSQQINESAIERALSRIAPTPPRFLLEFEALLNPSRLPSPFAALIPDAGTQVPLPTSINTAGVREATAATVKVYASGCSGIEAGSSWPAAPHYFITNAHVVAGSTRVVILPPQGGTYNAEVVFYDPNNDVAVLYVPGYTGTPLPYSSVNPVRGIQGAVIGYPGGNQEQSVPAAVRFVQDAQGFNLYRTAYVTRAIEFLEAVVIPGNSGGPIVDLHGTVIGMVFATSSINKNEGYALAPSTISSDIAAGEHSRAPASTQACLG